MKLPNISANVTRSTSGVLSTLIKLASNHSLTGTVGIQPQQSCRFCTGLVRGFREEEQFISCFLRTGSYRTCCCEVTGCNSCIFA